MKIAALALLMFLWPPCSLHRPKPVHSPGGLVCCKHPFWPVVHADPSKDYCTLNKRKALESLTRENFHLIGEWK